MKLHSYTITQGRDRAPARAMLKAVGLRDEDLRRPLIAIANTWIEVMPCNFHLRRLAEHVKAGVRAAGGTPIEFNTIAVSDGIRDATSPFRMCLRTWEREPPGASPTRNSWRSRTRRVPAPAPAVVNSRPTPWRP